LIINTKKLRITFARIVNLDRIAKKLFLKFEVPLGTPKEGAWNFSRSFFDFSTAVLGLVKVVLGIVRGKAWQ